jgi:putative hydrolase of the HAD superfamily
MSVRAVLFDAAGTLFGVRGSVGSAYAKVAARHGVVVAPEEIEQRFRAAFRDMPPLCFPGVPEADLPLQERRWWKQVVTTAFAAAQFDDFDAFFVELFEYFATPDAWELFSDVQPLLADLRRRRMRLAIVSNFDGRLLRICAGLGIAVYFDAVVISARAGFAKPDARIFAVALERLGISAGEALHVGDSEAQDIAGAHAAGVRAVLIDRPAVAGCAQRPFGGSAPRCVATERVADLRQLLAFVEP